MTDTSATPENDDKPIKLGDGWIEKDGNVIKEDLEEVLPQAEPTEGTAPLP